MFVVVGDGCAEAFPFHEAVGLSFERYLRPFPKPNCSLQVVNAQFRALYFTAFLRFSLVTQFDLSERVGYFSAQLQMLYFGVVELKVCFESFANQLPALSSVVDKIGRDTLIFPFWFVEDLKDFLEFFPDGWFLYFYLLIFMRCEIGITFGLQGEDGKGQGLSFYQLFLWYFQWIIDCFIEFEEGHPMQFGMMFYQQQNTRFRHRVRSIGNLVNVSESDERFIFRNCLT